MANQSRMKMVYRNSIITFISQLCRIFLGFWLRRTFIKQLGISYLGYNSVISNILQFLNLSDMGIGIAVTSYLYKPLAEGNQAQIRALMYIYKRIYQILGLLVAIIGSLISFFLPLIIKDAQCSYGYLRILYFMNLAGTVSSYYLAYRRTLFIADQRSYTIAIIDSGVYFIITFIQVTVLYLIPDYLIYLFLSILKNITSNIILSIKCRKDYPCLSQDVNHTSVQEFKQPLAVFVKDVFCSKIGSYIFNGTDNLIISIIRGSITTGYLSNYTLITGYANSLFSQAINSIQASFGNYINSETDIDKKEQMTKNYFCANYLVGNFCMICLMFLIQPFVQIVFGSRFLLPDSTAILLSINMLLSFLMQLPAQLFVIYKLYRYDKIIVLISATLNIIISYIGVYLIGINGALIGTMITSLIYLISRFYIVSKYIYQHGISVYLKQLLKYVMISIVNIAIVAILTSAFSAVSIPFFFIRAFIVSSLAVFIPILLLWKTKELKFFVTMILPGIKNK